jgi:hypothetical protein
MPHQHLISQEMKECAQICRDCSDTCTETIGHCLEIGGPHAERSHITLLALCAEICGTSAKALLMGSELHEHTCRACAAICEACADDCETMEEDFMKECAKVCRRCADSCREMSGGEKLAA